MIEEGSRGTLQRSHVRVFVPLSSGLNIDVNVLGG